MLEDYNFVTWEDLELAYRDFLKRKRSTQSAYEYMQIALRDLPKLLKELNTQTYKIGTSVTFCATRPKLREVFAASARDRVVHHLLILKFNEMFEHYSIDNSFNCRKGLGNSAMNDYVSNAISKHKDGWILKLDIKGCFMSMSKDVMWSLLEPAIRSWCHDNNYLVNDIDKWLWLWKLVVYHRPELDCVTHGDPTLVLKLPDDKTLTRTNGRGIAIGNLTSQILANFYFSVLDHALATFMEANGGEYGRYMDDMVLVADDKLVLIEASRLINKLLGDLELKLHPNKFYLQRAISSVKVVGVVHRSGRMYINNNTVDNAFKSIHNMMHKYMKDKYYLKDNLPHIISSVNSYLGLMKNYKAYSIRYKIVDTLPPELMKMVRNRKYNLLRIKPEFNKIKSQRINLAIRALQNTRRGRILINKLELNGN